MRHLPVKETSDLFLVQSDLFVLQNGNLLRNPERQLSGLPLIKFSPPFTNLDDYRKRIPSLPALLDLEFLELEGDVRFEEGVTLKGGITLISRGDPLTVRRNAVLENTQTVQ